MKKVINKNLYYRTLLCKKFCKVKSKRNTKDIREYGSLNPIDNIYSILSLFK